MLAEYSTLVFAEIEMFDFVHQRPSRNQDLLRSRIALFQVVSAEKTSYVLENITSHSQKNPSMCSKTIAIVLSISRQIVEVGCHFHHPVLSIQSLQLSSNGDLDLDTGLDVDDDLLNNLGRGVETVVRSA